MLATWFVAAFLILAHTAAVRDYIALLDGLGRPASGEIRTPLKQVIPARYADAQMWVRHALAAREAGELRVRRTSIDNAPAGREVHWSSLPTWLLRGAAIVQETVTGHGGTQAMERALLWLNAPLLIALLIGLSAWAACRAGAAVGMLVGAAMIGHARLYEGFTPAYVDHHGLVTVAAFGLVLGIVFAGGGWWRPSAPASPRLLPESAGAARRAAAVSALAGAVGLWLSAATILPVIAWLGVAALLMTWWVGRAATNEGALFEPGVWRVWGRVGAMGSLACWLIEYAPANFGLRLEVNHPLYAAAWWGGAEFVAVLAAWRIAPGAEPRSLPLRRRLLPLVAVTAVPLTIAAGGTAVFLVADPFVGDLRHFVAEGKSLPATIREFGLGRVMADVPWVLVVLTAVWLAWRRRGEARLLLGLVAIVACAFAIMGCFEVRWWGTGGAVQVPLLLVVIAVVSPAQARSRWIWTAALSGVLCGWPAVQRIVKARLENQRHAVAEVDLLPPLYRDIAARLRDTQPEGDIVLLANPNASAGIGYFGRFKAIGTLYWENAPGLRAAAEIFSARTDEEAFARLRARGVTHVALLSTTNFLGEYFQLLHPGATEAEMKQSFGYRLLTKQAAPPWLQPVPYRVPAELARASTIVLLFKTAADQTEAERLYHTIIARAAAGEIEAAESILRRMLGAAPPEQRAALAAEAGMGLYDFGADAAAARVLRSALDVAHDPTIANTLAWILATTDDPALRNGRIALTLVEPVLRGAPSDPAVLSTFAAACAEVGRFADAVNAAERALAAVRAARDTAAEPLLARRLETYRAGRPWRQ